MAWGRDIIGRGIRGNTANHKREGLSDLLLFFASDSDGTNCRIISQVFNIIQRMDFHEATLRSS